MINKVKVDNIADIVKGSDFIDCYVSTDASEIEDILEGLNYVDITDAKKADKNINSLVDAYEGYEDGYDSELKHKTTKLRIDCVDIPLEECLKIKSDIGFTPMAKFRVYTNKSTNIVEKLVEVLKALNAERQNMAFMNQNYTKIFVKLSEFYC